MAKKVRRFTDREKAAIVRWHAGGLSRKEIARRLSAHESSISNILRAARAEISELEIQRSESIETLSKSADVVGERALTAARALLDESINGTIEPKDSAAIIKSAADLQRVNNDRLNQEPARETRRLQNEDYQLRIKINGARLAVIQMSDVIITHATEEELAQMRAIAQRCEQRALRVEDKMPRTRNPIHPNHTG